MKKQGYSWGIKKMVIIVVLSALSSIVSCYSITDETYYMKDLNENMLNLRAYHENLGGALKQNDMDIAAWLTNGMDSVLTVMLDNFKKTENFKNLLVISIR